MLGLSYLQSGYGSEEDLETGYDSENDSEREEIELALYNQIHYLQAFSSQGQLETELQESCVGPGGDNCTKSQHIPSTEISVVEIQSDSICDLKTRKYETNPDKSQRLPNKKSFQGIKRKRDFSDCVESSDVSNSEDIPDKDEDFFFGEFSTESDTDNCDSNRLNNTSVGDIMMNIDVHDTGTSSSTYSVSSAGEGTDGDQKWSVIDADRLAGEPRSRYRAARYYKPFDVKTPNVRCRNCNEMGHLSRTCPKPQKYLICYLCGETGHNFRNCPTSICYNCETASGHTAKQCPQPWRRGHDVCHRCKMMGHRQHSCPDLWRQYHITTEDGKLKTSKMKTNPKVYCHNCGEKGHYGFECEDERVNAHSPATYPYIVRYHLPKVKTKPGKCEKVHRDTGEEPASKRQKLEDSSARSSKQISVHAKHLLNPPSKSTYKRRKRKEKRKEKREEKRKETAVEKPTYSAKEVLNPNQKAGEKKVKNKKKKKKRKGANKNQMRDKELADINKSVVKKIQSSKSEITNSKQRQLEGSKRKSKQSDLVIHTKRGFNIVLPNLTKSFRG